MVEYGQGVGEVGGRVGGSGGGGGSGTDVGAGLASMISESVDRVAALPPETLVLLLVLVLAGLMILRRAL
jgi:hypothetical protein